MLKYLNDLPKDQHYEIGMYGGKFLPMHKGHLYCVEQASKLCDTLYLLLFWGGVGEEFIRKSDDREMFYITNRLKQMNKVSLMFDNVIPRLIDISACKLPNGNEDWDAETPLVLNIIGRQPDAVFGSEPVAYAPYFERAYPQADYIIIDAERKTVPISATMIRNEMSEEEAKKWII